MNKQTSMTRRKIHRAMMCHNGHHRWISSTNGDSKVCACCKKKEKTVQ